MLDSDTWEVQRFVNAEFVFTDLVLSRKITLCKIIIVVDTISGKLII